MSQKGSLSKGRIGYADESAATNDLVFQYNPTSREFHRSATYTRNQAALADFPNAQRSARPAFQWVRNEPEETTIELFFHADSDRTIESYLKKLDDFMRPSQTSGRPRQLILVWGAGRSDIVRILEKTTKERLYNRQLQCQEAIVQLKLGVEVSRSR